MYYEYFGFRESPFSIAPDPRYLYLSERHKEALAHLMFGVQGQGGFIVISGEVGTGKTTVSRCFINNVPEHVDIALVLNPKLSVRELLANIGDELGVRSPAGASIKRLIDDINRHLLDAHARGRHTVLIIDEAQNLDPDVLEQLRLLTNLETAEKKLLQIVLLGQPELLDMLEQPALRQLSQRITARYHLDVLSKSELAPYLRFRLSVAGQRAFYPFDSRAETTLYRLSGGTPRLINLICDRALLGAYANNSREVTADTLKRAAREVLGRSRRWSLGLRKPVTQKEAPATANMPPWLGWLNLVLVIGLLVMVSFLVLDRKVSAPLADAGKAEVTKKLVATGALAPRTVATETRDLALLSEATAEVAAAISITTPVTDTGAANPLHQLATTTGDKRSAFANLFVRWHLDFTESDGSLACAFAESKGLRCLHRQGNWRSLMQLDRPAVLRLVDGRGAEHFVTLNHLADDQATILLDDQPITLSKAALDEYWLGDYSILWRAPPYDTALIRPGQTVNKAEWIADQLARIVALQRQTNAGPLPGATATVEDLIRWYQGQKGLIADGLVGALTLIAFANDLGADEPRLLTAPALASGASTTDITQSARGR